MATKSNLAFVNSFGDIQDTSSTDKLQYAGFLTANYELTDELLGKLVNAINATTGASDAAKFIKTDGAGKIDNSFINFQAFDKAFVALVGTTAALPAVTYANGTGGVGATLTADANGALPQIDGITLNLGERILVKNQASALQNGIYTVTVVGDAGTAFVLTRATNWDNADKIDPVDLVAVEKGTANADKVFILTSDDPITVGTTDLVFASMGTTQFSAGDGLSFSGNILNVNPGNGIKIATDTIAVEPSDIAGSGLKDDGSDNLAIDWYVPVTDDPTAVDKAVDVSDLFGYSAGQGGKIVGFDKGSITLTDATTVQGALEDAFAAIAEADAPGVDYTVGAGGIAKAEVVYISGNDTVVKYSDVTVDQNLPGIAWTTEIATATVKVVKDSVAIAGVLTALTPTAGQKVYWTGSALTLSAPSAGRVVQVGYAKNANDLHVDVAVIKRNA